MDTLIDFYQILTGDGSLDEDTLASSVDRTHTGPTCGFVLKEQLLSVQRAEDVPRRQQAGVRTTAGGRVVYSQRMSHKWTKRLDFFERLFLSRLPGIFTVTKGQGGLL